MEDKKYIVWVDYGYEGWAPTYYDTLQECVDHNSYGSRKIITKLLFLDITEKE